MKIGTRSLLFGCHQVLLHPLFVLAAWIRLYGLPGPSALLAIIVHDWGYLGCSDMDGPSGGDHPFRVADALHLLGLDKAAVLVGRHSRFACRIAACTAPSRLMYADKLGTALMPAWLWGLLAKMTGEYQEYTNGLGRELHGLMTSTEFMWRYRGVVRRLLQEERSGAACNSFAEAWRPRMLPYTGELKA